MRLKNKSNGIVTVYILLRKYTLTNFGNQDFVFQIQNFKEKNDLSREQ